MNNMTNNIARVTYHPRIPELSPPVQLPTPNVPSMPVIHDGNSNNLGNVLLVGAVVIVGGFVLKKITEIAARYIINKTGEYYYNKITKHTH